MLHPKSDNKHGLPADPQFQYDALKNGYDAHGAEPYYEEHFPFDMANSADQIGLFEAKTLQHEFDPASFDRRKDCHVQGEYERPQDGNPARCRDWYKDIESDVWAYAGDARNGTCKDAWDRPEENLATKAPTQLECIELFKESFPSANLTAKNYRGRIWGSHPFPDTGHINSIPLLWRTGRT